MNLSIVQIDVSNNQAVIRDQSMTD
jgi:hypothetical protein